MNFKKTAIALAMAGVVATPMAAQADVYASARIGIENVDGNYTAKDGTKTNISDLRVRSFGSRFGVKSETDLGNGLTGFGKYEWDVDFTDHSEDINRRRSITGNTTAENNAALDSSDNDDIDVRHRYVGVKGDFGSVLIGQTHHTYYNFVAGKTDNPWWGSGYFFDTTGRQDNGITYTGGVGDIAFGVTTFLERDTQEDAVDRTEAAISFGISDMTLGLGLISYQDSADDASTALQDESDTKVGIVLTGISLGDLGLLGVGYQSQDEVDQFVIDASIGNGYIHYESQDSGKSSASDPSAITLGYTQSLGRNTLMYYEIVDIEKDTNNSDDDTTIVRAVLKYDII